MRKRHLASLALVAGLALPAPARAADYQWSTTLDTLTSDETKRPPRAFLWIPPNCGRVRGVVVGQHNMQEAQILEHPAFRAALADLGFACVWVTPAFDPFFRFDKGAGDHFDAMMRRLADESGYAELAAAPVVPIGHSAMASYPSNFAAWSPSRTLAAISVSGQWPFPPGEDKNRPDWTGKSIDGVPTLVTIGEYEWAGERWAEGAKERAAHPRLPLSFLGVPADGHFAALDDKVAFLALYLRKAAEHRLPTRDGDPLVAIDPTRVGWLADTYRKDAPPRWPAAPVGSYAGEASQAFWWFDEETALAAERLATDNRGKRGMLVGYVQDDAIVPQVNGTHQQVTLKWLPHGDGLTFRLSGAFLDAVPDGRPMKWVGKGKDEPIDHPATADQIRIARITGPVAQVTPDTWALRFDRLGFDNAKRSNDVWFVATHEGDATYKRAVQQAQLRFPLTNKSGAPQTITFDAPPDRPTADGTIRLRATSSANAPVHFYVREGPAEIDGDETLRFTAIPPRAKFPVKVTVVAWQWGRSIEPRLQSATPIERTFHILGPGGTVAPPPAPRAFPTTAKAPPSTRAATTRPAP